MYCQVAIVCLFVVLCQTVLSDKADKLQKKWDLNGKHKSFATDMVKSHNEARKKETKAKPQLKNLVWDKDLSAKAQKWADGCDYKHSHEKGVGENIAARGVIQAGKTDLMSDKSARTEMLNAMDDPTFKMGWYDEKPFFKYPVSCQKDKVCGHYTQVVWADTKKVGCGIAQCKDIICDKKLGCFNGLYVVCKYSPPGNVIYNGDKRPPYKTA